MTSWPWKSPRSHGLLHGLARLGEDTRRSAWLLAGLAVAISALFAFLIFPLLVVPLRVHYMLADGYYALAESLLSGRGFVFGSEPGLFAGAFKREPVYPLFLAVFLGLPGFPDSLILAHIGLHAGITVLSYRLFLDAGVAQKLAFWSAALFATFPFSFWYIAKPTPENLSPLFLVLNVWLLQRYLRRPGAGPAALWGLSWAVASLAKSNLILLGPIGVLVTAIYGRRRPQLLVHMTVAILLFGMGLAPWVARNYQLSGRFIWGSAMGGTAFFVGNRNANWDTVLNLGTEHAGEDAVEAEWKEAYYRRRASVANPDPFRLEAETDAWFAARVKPWIWANKAAFARKVAINAATLWFITHDPAKSLILFVFQAPLLLGALVGLWLAWRRRWSSLEAHMALVMGSIYATSCMILADGRYTHVFLPFTAYFATVAAARFIGLLPQGDRALQNERG